MCEHSDDPVPFFLGNLSLVTLEHKTQAKAIGTVVETLLGLPASECVPEAEGYSPKLETALDGLRGTPFNLKIIIGMTPDGKKNVLEVVHAVPTVDVITGTASFPETAWRLVDTNINGIPPCALNSLQHVDGQKMLFERPVNAIQMLVSITDTGEEHDSMSKDEELVRLKRSGVCCLSGLKVVLHRTGHLRSMNKYLRWNRGDVIFVVVRILDYNGDTWNLAIKGSRKFNTVDNAEVFNTYFTQYVALAQSIWKFNPLEMDHAWTPKRRRAEIMSPTTSADSMGILSPKTFEKTPLTFRNTPGSS